MTVNSNSQSGPPVAESAKFIRVLIVEDDVLVRIGLKLTVDRMPGIQVVGEAGNGRLGVDLTLDLQPDVVLLDIGLPVLSGIEALAEIKRLRPSTRVLMVTSQDSDDIVAGALKAGADGYCLKNVISEQLRKAIQAVYAGTAWLDPSVADRRVVTGD